MGGGGGGGEGESCFGGEVEDEEEFVETINGGVFGVDVVVDEIETDDEAGDGEAWIKSL